MGIDQERISIRNYSDIKEVETLVSSMLKMINSEAEEFDMILTLLSSYDSRDLSTMGPQDQYDLAKINEMLQLRNANSLKLLTWAKQEYDFFVIDMSLTLKQEKEGTKNKFTESQIEWIVKKDLAQLIILITKLKEINNLIESKVKAMMPIMTSLRDYLKVMNPNLAN